MLFARLYVVNQWKLDPGSLSASSYTDRDGTITYFIFRESHMITGTEDTLKLPVSGTALRSTQQKASRWMSFFWSPLWLCLLLALAVRAWLIVHTNGVMDGDESMVALQAINILHGALPIYFYGQAYMGSLEAYLVTLLFAVFGPSVWALRTEAALLSLVLVGLTWRLAGVLANAAGISGKLKRNFMVIAAVGAAIPPLYDGVVELRLLGGYIETFVLMLWLILSAFQLTQRWFHGATHRELVWRWAGIGLIVGLGFWVDPLIISAILAAALWILGNCLLEVFRRKKDQARTQTRWQPLRELLLALVAIPTFLLGAAPAIDWGATHQWANITYILNQGGHPTLKQKLLNIFHVTRSYLQCVSPRLIGGALTVENTLQRTLHLLALIFGVFCILGVLVCIFLSLRYVNSTFATLRNLAGLPMLFAGCTALIFCTSPAAIFELISCQLDDSGRYATPIALALPFFFATIFTGISLYLQRQKSLANIDPQQTEFENRQPVRSARPGRSLRILLFILSVLLLCNFGIQALTYAMTSAGATFQSSYCKQDPFDDTVVLNYLEQQHIHYFWANNMLAYPLVFKSNESIIASDPTALLQPKNTVNRLPDYTNALLKADRPSLLFVIAHTNTQPQIFQILDQLGITYRQARFFAQPGFDVLVVTPLNHTFLPIGSLKFDIFSCVSH
jgi:hypothetical protein